MAKSFFDAADRLRRKTWTDLGEFANEVFTVFKTGKIDTSKGASFSNDDDQGESPITTKQRADDQFPAITITKGDQTATLSLGDNGGLTFSDGAGNAIPLNGVDGISATDGSRGATGDTGQAGDPGTGQNGQNGQTGEVRSNASGLAGIVGAKTSGSVYAVTCYDKDPSSNPAIGTVNMTAANVDPEETIPPGMEVVAIGFFNAGGTLTGGRFYPAVFVTGNT